MAYSADVTLAQVVGAVETLLSTAVTVNRSQSYDELTESINRADLPLLQVYWERCELRAGRQQSFRGGVQELWHILHADYYAAVRSTIGQDMGRLVDGIEALTDVLQTETTDTTPYFDQTGIQDFEWSAERVVFTYASTDFVGARFTLGIRIF